MRINEVAAVQARKVAEKLFARLSCTTRKARSRRKVPLVEVDRGIGVVGAIRGSRRMTT